MSRMNQESIQSYEVAGSGIRGTESQSQGSEFMTFKNRLMSSSVHLGASMLVVAMLSWTSSAVADATNRILAVGDFGSAKATNDNPDGFHDLLWLDFPSGQIFIQYIDEEGIRVRNRIGCIDHIKVLSRGSGYFTDNRIVVDNPSSGGGQLDAQLNVIGPVSEVTIIDPGRDYITPPGGILDMRLIDGDPEASGGTGFSYTYTLAAGGASSGEVAEIQVLDGGSGYPAGDPGAPRPMALIASHPSGDLSKAAFATVWVDETGTILSGGAGPPTVIQNGSDFTETPEWGFLSDPGDGSGAVFQAFLFGGVNGFLGDDVGEPPLSSGGLDYREDPEVEFIDPGPDGTGAKFGVVRGPGPVTNVEIIDPGRNFTRSPRLTISGPGTGANIEPILNRNGTKPVKIAASSEPGKMSWLNVKAYLGDFDGDGDTDIYFRHPKRNPSFVWFMENGEILEYGPLDIEVGPGWSVIGTDDFDGDGDDELLWFNKVNGITTIWNIDHVPGDPGQWIGPGTVTTWPVPDSNWQPITTIESTGSNPGASVFWYNHVQKASAIRKRNPDNPGNVYWVRLLIDTDGNQVLAGPGFFPKVNGDFDGDGLRDDMLWQNLDDGRIAVWIMEDEVVSEVIIVTYQGEGDPIIAWEPAGVGQYEVDANGVPGTGVDVASVFWQCSGANISYIWPMRSPSSSSSGLGSFSGLFLGFGSSGSTGQGLSDVEAVYRVGMRGSTYQLSNVDVYGGGGDDGGGGQSGYDINQFDPRNPATWPDGITNPIAMIGWLTANVTAADPSSWPDSVNNEEELTVWLATQVAALSGL